MDEAGYKHTQNPGISAVYGSDSWWGEAATSDEGVRETLSRAVTFRSSRGFSQDHGLLPGPWLEIAVLSES